MPRRKLNYREGDWFALPLRDGGWALGLAARIDGRGAVIGYFFGPRLPTLPGEVATADRRPEDAVFVASFGDLGLLDGSWKVICHHRPWEREAWPLPTFARQDVLSGAWTCVQYSDEDLTVPIREYACDDETARRLPEDGAWGAGAVERRLTGLLR